MQLHRYERPFFLLKSVMVAISNLHGVRGTCKFSTLFLYSLPGCRDKLYSYVKHAKGGERGKGGGRTQVFRKKAKNRLGRKTDKKTHGKRRKMRAWTSLFFTRNGVILDNAPSEKILPIKITSIINLLMCEEKKN